MILDWRRECTSKNSNNHTIIYITQNASSN